MNEILSIDEINERCPTKTKWPVRDGCLPKSISLIGLILQVQRIRLVGWKEEVIITLSDVKDTRLEISFWKNHDAPRFGNFDDLSVFKGKIVLIKRIFVRSHELINGIRTYYSFIPQGHSRWIQILDDDATNINKFVFEGSPLKTDPLLSEIPENAMDKKAGKQFPNWESEDLLVLAVLKHMARFFDASILRFHKTDIDLMRSGYLEWLKESRPLDYTSKLGIGKKLKKWLSSEEVLILWQSSAYYICLFSKKHKVMHQKF